ncbi:MAG TPA: hypothetical protein VJK03_05260 [Candidatus Nanoarchaeia archaeon]|nr:hypothetical protein [Candidatus Nanoarchaeia archaeon]
MITFRDTVRKPYIFWTLGIFIIYLILNLLLSGFYKNIPLIARYASTVNWAELGISIGLALIIGILVSATGVIAYERYRQRKHCLEGSVAASVGTIGGLAAGFCPICLTGLFPLLFGFFGASFSFASLPFKGIELQISAIIILLASLWFFHKR